MPFAGATILRRDDAAEQVGPTNEIINPSVENDLTGYAQVGATVTRITTDAKYGAACARSTIVGTGQSISFPANQSAAVPVVPGDLLFMRGAIKRIDPGNAFTSVPSLRWRAWNSGLTVIFAQVSMGADSTAAGIWEELAGLVVAPPSAAFMVPCGFLQGSTAGTTYELREDGFMVVKNPLNHATRYTEPMDDLASHVQSGGPGATIWIVPTGGSAVGFLTQAGVGYWSPADTNAHGMVATNFGDPTVGAPIRDGRLTLRFRTGSTIHTAVRLVFRSNVLFTNDRLRMTILNDRIRFEKVVSNVSTTLVTGTTGITFAANTDYSLRCTFVEDKVTGTIWQGDPDVGTCVGSVSWVMSAADYAGLLAAAGFFGFEWQAPTDYRFYDHKAEVPTNVLPAYIGGDQPGCIWLGTPHASKSRKV